ncbi:MAG: hypothetical protein COA78_11855, partial [Blastopirellula sp.]
MFAACFTGCDQNETTLNELGKEIDELKVNVTAAGIKAEEFAKEKERAEQLTKENADLTKQIADLKSAKTGSESTVIEQEKFGGVIAKKYEESKEWWPKPHEPPKGTPNVIIFLLDDVGFAQFECFGGLIETPNI